MSSKHASRRFALPFVLLVGSFFLARPAHAESSPDNSGFVFAIEGGVARVLGMDSPYGGNGYGKGLIFGYRFGAFTAELQTVQSYTTELSDSDLRARNTQGNVKLTSFGLRYSQQMRYFTATAFGGAARAQVPLLGQTDEGIDSITVAGIGGIGGLGAAFPIREGALELGVELRAFYGTWEIPKAGYYTDIQQSGTTTTGRLTTEDVSPMPVTLNVGVRAFF